LALEWKLTMIVGQNTQALEAKQTYPHGNVDRITCCKNLKTEALKQTISGLGARYRLNHQTKTYELDSDNQAFTGMIAGIRSDEEGSRSKERYFSARGETNQWEISEQPPEFWNQFKTDFSPGTHVRVHPLLDWTELNIWEYIERESIPVVSLYFDQGSGKRYRSLGCHPCTTPIESEAKNVSEIIRELKTGKLSHVAERSGRAQDKEDGGGLETLRRDGYM
jgi:sulfate adenylyltransferase subunit 2